MAIYQILSTAVSDSTRPLVQEVQEHILQAMLRTAFFHIGNEEKAIDVVARVAAKLPTASAAQSQNNRPRPRDQKAAKRHSYRSLLSDKSALAYYLLLQELELFEVSEERAGRFQTPSDQIRCFIKQIAKTVLKHNSWYAAVAITQILADYPAAITISMYDEVAPNRSGTKDWSAVSTAKESFVKDLMARFKDRLDMHKQGAAWRFISRKPTPEEIQLISQCLNNFLPPSYLPHHPPDIHQQQLGTIESMQEMTRLQTFFTMKLFNKLASTVGATPIEPHLAIPIFDGVSPDDPGPGFTDRTPVPEFDLDRVKAAIQHYSPNQKLASDSLFIVVDGVQRATLDVASPSCRMLLEDGAGIVELVGLNERNERITIATYVLTYSDESKTEQWDIAVPSIANIRCALAYAGDSDAVDLSCSAMFETVPSLNLLTTTGNAQFRVWFTHSNIDATRPLWSRLWYSLWGWPEDPPTEGTRPGTVVGFASVAGGTGASILPTVAWVFRQGGSGKSFVEKFLSYQRVDDVAYCYHPNVYGQATPSPMTLTSPMTTSTTGSSANCVDAGFYNHHCWPQEGVESAVIVIDASDSCSHDSLQEILQLMTAAKRPPQSVLVVITEAGEMENMAGMKIAVAHAHDLLHRYFHGVSEVFHISASENTTHRDCWETVYDHILQFLRGPSRSSPSIRRTTLGKAVNLVIRLFRGVTRRRWGDTRISRTTNVRQIVGGPMASIKSINLQKVPPKVVWTDRGASIDRLVRKQNLALQTFLKRADQLGISQNPAPHIHLKHDDISRWAYYCALSTFTLSAISFMLPLGPGGLLRFIMPAATAISVVVWWKFGWSRRLYNSYQSAEFNIKRLRSETDLSNWSRFSTARALLAWFLADRARGNDLVAITSQRRISDVLCAMGETARAEHIAQVIMSHGSVQTANDLASTIAHELCLEPRAAAALTHLAKDNSIALDAWNEIDFGSDDQGSGHEHESFMTGHGIRH